jgi:hypothetical protein
MASPNEKTEETCVTEAKSVSRALRYGTLRDCFDGITPKISAMPLGRFKAPSDGWLVMAEDGHCERVRAYDLATGAAIVAHGCRGNASGPSVDVGRVPLGALREATFFLFFAGVVEQHVRPEGHTYAIDADISIGRPVNESRTIRLSGFSTGGGSRRVFSWMRAENGIVKGRLSGTIAMGLTFPDANAHASELLTIAEDGFESGCAPAAPPPAIAWSSPGPAVYGAAADFLRPSYDALRAAVLAPRTPGKNCGIMP